MQNAQVAFGTPTWKDGASDQTEAEDSYSCWACRGGDARIVGCSKGSDFNIGYDHLASDAMVLLSCAVSVPQVATSAGQPGLVVVRDRDWIVQKRRYLKDERHEGWVLPANVLRNRKEYVASSGLPGVATLWM